MLALTSTLRIQMQLTQRRPMTKMRQQRLPSWSSIKLTMTLAVSQLAPRTNVQLVTFKRLVLPTSGILLTLHAAKQHATPSIHALQAGRRNSGLAFAIRLRALAAW